MKLHNFDISMLSFLGSKGINSVENKSVEWKVNKQSHHGKRWEKSRRKIHVRENTIEREKLSDVTSPKLWKLKAVLVVGLIINYLEYSPHYTQKKKYFTRWFFPLDYVKNICQSRFLVEDVNIVLWSLIAASTLSEIRPCFGYRWNIFAVIE